MPGAENLRDSKPLEKLLKQQRSQDRMIGAICASPAVVLASHGLVADVRATCYPSMTEQLTGAKKVKEPVVVDRNCITSQGPGTALPFALKIVELLFGEQKAREVAAAMLFKL
jgi:4-methyl-5(b-hydroxyethyl)-thiazole monophosphate biosynthesis